MSTAEEIRCTPPPSDSGPPPEVHETPANGNKGNRFNIFEDAKEERENMLGELKGNVVFGMPVKEFLNLIPHPGHVPSRVLRGNAFKELPQGTEVVDGRKKNLEARLYDSLAKIIGKLLGPEFVVKVTARNSDKHATPDKQWKPDLIAYLKKHLPKLEMNITDFSLAELLHEVKLTDFGCDVDADKLTPEQREAHVPIKFGIEGEDNLAQIALCLVEQNNRQHRTHSFHVFYSNNIARLLRHDHAGIIISKGIEFRKDSKDLEEFYYRYKHATPEARGHDTSVRYATRGEATLARFNIPPPEHGLSRPLFVIDLSGLVAVEDSLPEVDASDNGQTQQSPELNIELHRKARAVLVWGAMSELRCLTGRTTKAFVAMDIDTHELLFLKDTWRADVPGMEKEGDILRALGLKKVPHVPKLLSGGDVTGAYQRTVTQDFINAPWRTGHIGDMSPRAHYRILEDMIPERIDNFKTPKEMLECVGHALIAHQSAYENCRILHRDVTANNIMITKNKITEKREGVLCDWDLAVHIIKDDEGKPVPRNCSRQSHRTATWAFASVELLYNVSKCHDFKDDLESFFWIVLYLSLAHLPFTTKRRTSFPLLKADIFNEERDIGPEKEGGASKRRILYGEAELGGLDFTDNKGLNYWYKHARNAFKALMDYNVSRNLNQDDDDDSSSENGFVTAPNLSVQFPASMSSHQYILKLTTAALKKEWADNRKDDLNDPIRCQLSKYKSAFSVPNVEVGAYRKRLCPTIEEEEKEDPDYSAPKRPHRENQQSDDTKMKTRSAHAKLG